MLSRLGYFVHTAWAGLVRARGLTAMSTLTLAAALFVVGAFAMALNHGRDLMRAWGEGGHISCAIAPFVSEDRWPALRDTVAALPGVREVQLVPPDVALQRYCARGRQACALVEGVDAKLLPAALHITPAASMVSGTHVAELAHAVGSIAGVEDVAYSAARLQEVRKMMRTGAWLALGLMGMLASAMVFMVANTIRLMIYARQDEVRILRLVGATRWFVRAPFLIEGLTWGLCAGALGALGLRGVDALFAEPLAQAQALLGHPHPLTLYAWPVALVQLGTGAALALSGSLLALHRFMDEDVG